eukprot:TRINITY_DN94704_c0_g1_i1.p1 TRINITY_DN94704_c0_g1~~TRINITY_DN94704_c0_g1_i1.p1  ORF type:complete len:455 (+),score=42.14 TRINITY_DN94704_c0_g1_i1:16-1380(+)
MRKLLSLMCAGAIAFGANAQESATKSLVFRDNGTKMRPGNTDYKNFVKQRNAVSGANKTTGPGGNKWYSTYDIADGYLGNVLSNNDFVFYIGWDSLLKQRFSTTTGPVNWLSIASFIDPINSDGFNSATLFAGTDIRIQPWNSYTVDSIFFPGAYIKSPTGGASTIDTLYLSVAPVAYNDASTTSAADPDVANYQGVTANGGVLKVQRLGATDSLHRRLGNAGAVSWALPLIDTLRKSKNTDGTFPVHNFLIKLPSTLTVPAGSGVAMSVAFKPGEAWAAGDSVQQHHYFMPLASEGADNTVMPYFYYQYHDHSMSYLMHYSNQGGYSSAISLELANTNAYNYEFINMAMHINCANCATIDGATGVTNVSVIKGAKAYPNPANNELNIAFGLNETANTTVSISNTVGQVVMSKTLTAVGNGEVSFSTANLSNGVYFYTVEANGQRQTERFVVAH